MPVSHRLQLHIWSLGMKRLVWRGVQKYKWGFKSTIINKSLLPDLPGNKATKHFFCLRRIHESARITSSQLALQSFRTREYSRGPRSAKRLLEAVQNVSDQFSCLCPFESHSQVRCGHSHSVVVSRSTPLRSCRRPQKLTLRLTWQLVP